MSSQSRFAVVVQDSPSKVPLLLPGDISPTVMRNYEHACYGYFDTKDIAADKQVRKVIAGLRDPRIQDWVGINRDRLLQLEFGVFIAEFKAAYLPKDWEEITRIELLQLTQGNDNFWDFSVQVQTKNSLLINTPSHLNDEQLRHRMESGMNPKLALRCRLEKAGVVQNNDLNKLATWLTDIKRVDDLIRAERADFHEFALKTRESTRRSNTLTEPSRRVNSAPVITVNTSNAPIPSTSRAILPKLTSTERQLLYDNEGCLKCRRVYVAHRSSNCPNDFPDPSAYKTLTQSFVDLIKRRLGKPIAAVLNNESTVPAVAVPVLAAVMGTVNNPAAYMPSNTENVIEGDSGSDSEVRVVPSIASVNVAKDSVALKAQEDIAPLTVPHLFWRACANGGQDDFPVTFDALLDHGSHTVLISDNFAASLKLKRRKLHEPMSVEMAIPGNDKKIIVKLFDWVKLRLYDPSGAWTSKTLRAVVAPSLCANVILGGPFLAHNNIVVDHSTRTAVDKISGFDLLNPTSLKPKPKPKRKLKEFFHDLKADRALMVAELKMVCAERKCALEHKMEIPKPFDTLGAVRQRIETLTCLEELNRLGEAVKEKYKDIFEPIPHLDELPTDVYCRIKLKDAKKSITTRSYSTPRKYKEAWATLIQQHLDAGRIRPSNSEHASPAFLVPKADTIVLPRWVNDYRVLNANTVTDSHPLPRVDDILADCAKGKIWSVIDMTNSFFQTRVHPDDVHLTAVTTPFGLYEWLAMPMGLRNSPAIHQRRMTAALREHLSKFCHIYLDDIIIWSDNVAEHAKHIDIVMKALRKAKLYCNPNKCKFFQKDVDFLGHHISERGIEANSSKIDKIMNWPVPKTATDVRAFLGLVRYISLFLPNLAEHTRILTPLTTKDCRKNFPQWTVEHQTAFEAVKALVVSADCLTTIDHDSPGDNKIFVTCDASDWRIGATLSFGPTWETARPVAFDSMQLKAAEKNYPVHEKELLAIIRALKKWRSDLLGSHFIVYTDHRTLENFDTQKDLSRRQLRWQEFMSQYDMTITYIRGEDNTVADALSRLPPNCFPGEAEQVATTAVNAILSISTDQEILTMIKDGYREDEFCKRVATTNMTGWRQSNGLWYIGDRLLIPRVTSIRETLFRLAHDTLGHFGADKSYASLRDAYYWPNMRRDLEQAYIPSCVDCLRNKSRTSKQPGPLHPLPIPEDRGSSVAMDFIGPLPLDDSYDCILTMTDRLGSDIRIVPTKSNLTAEELAVVFFDNWYCENGLPSDIVCDRDKLFVSRFWRALTKLTGVKLKMSSSYHPETDGSSERSNKTVNQMLRYHVRRNQKGWARALPRIRFQIMNTRNASTGFSGFQLLMGRSPRVIPPIIPSNLPPDLQDAAKSAADVLSRLNDDVAQARDNLMLAKITQAHNVSTTRAPDPQYKVGDWVMLSTANRRHEYKKKGEKRAAKFFPRWDGPFCVTKCNTEASTYTLDLPTDAYPTFHVAQLKRHLANDSTLFPSREFEQPGPTMTPDGLEEFFVEKIIDSRRRGRGWQFLVRWLGYAPQHDLWIAAAELDDCEALDKWYEEGGDGPDSR